MVSLLWMKQTFGQHANYQLFPFTMLKIMGVCFLGWELSPQKEKLDTTWKSHCDPNLWMWHLVFLFFTWVNPHYKGNSRKSFSWRSLYNLCLPILLPFLSFGKEKIWDFSKASWYPFGIWSWGRPST